MDPHQYRREGEAVKYAPIWCDPQKIGLVWRSYRQPKEAPAGSSLEDHWYSVNEWVHGPYGSYGLVATHRLGIQFAVVGIITGAAILTLMKK